MCGIAGIVGREPVDAGILRAMTAALARRGPDGEGFHIDGGTGLGHRRLAILDVGGGAQPLFAAGGRVAGIVNGEIYNFAELRAGLERRGHRFVTRADSEVVVHGYAEWGYDVLDRLEGQFALAVWDSAKRSLLLARDRMGEKPLFYRWSPAAGRLVFASELTALRRHPDVAGAAVDPAALARYLVYEYVPAPLSILRGVHKLEPGQALVATPGQTPRLFTYWDLPLPAEEDAGAARPRDLHETAHELRSALRASVARRLVADVPVGVFLSGGLDSSLVAALAAEIRGGDLDTFNMGFADPSYDESPHARLVARAIGSRHHQHMASAGDALALVENLGDLLDEPLGDASLVPTHLLARFAREHVTVALGGDGGDELFSGYPTLLVEFLARPVFDHLPRGAARHLRRALSRAAALALPASAAHFSFDFKLKQLIRGLGERGPRRHQAWLASLLPDEALALLSPEALAAAGAAAGEHGVDLYDVVDRRMARCAARHPADRLLYFYAKGYLGDDVLAKVDRASMHVALEVRAPLLDTRIIGIACRAHPWLRARGPAGKRVLERAARGLVPDAIIDRPKHGFAMPVAAWLRGPLAPMARDLLAPSRLAGDGLLQPAAVQSLLEDHIAGRANHRKPLWTLLAFQTWLAATR